MGYEYNFEDLDNFCTAQSCHLVQHSSKKYQTKNTRRKIKIQTEVKG